MTDLSRYPKQVFWSDEDEGFIAIAPDLPGCSAFGETEVAALAELDNAIEAWIDAARAAGNATPAPSRPALRKEYSGKLLVRMPQSLHHELANAAKNEEVSLNQFIVFVLARYFSGGMTAIYQSNASSVSIGSGTAVVGYATTSPEFGSARVVGANSFTAVTAPRGNVVWDVLQLPEERHSWADSLGKWMAIQGNMHEEVARNIYKVDSLAIRSGRE